MDAFSLHRGDRTFFFFFSTFQRHSPSSFEKDQGRESNRNSRSTAVEKPSLLDYAYEHADSKTSATISQGRVAKSSLQQKSETPTTQKN